MSSRPSRSVRAPALAFRLASCRVPAAGGRDTSNPQPRAAPDEPSPIDEDDDETRPRILSNTQILGYIARHWLREPVRFALAGVLIVVAAALRPDHPLGLARPDERGQQPAAG